MKKYFFFLCSAITALLMTSCSEEDIFNGQVGDVVTFNVSIPELATRAAGDGTSANKLYWGVYDHEGKLLGSISNTAEGKVFIGSDNVKLTLAKDRSYSVIFWAANNDNSMCNVNWTERKMTVSPTNANQESYDAFCAYVPIENVSGYMTRDIKLSRPFAQINIGTADVEEAKNSGLTVKNTKVEIKGLPDTYNFVTGEASSTEDKLFTYDYPTDATSFDNESFPVDGYEYLSMNYALVSSEKELVDITFTYKDNEDEEHSRSFSSVPVQRNYRTNIYGNILTSDADYNVEIKPDFNEPAHEPAELFLAAAVGGEVTLTEDVVLTAPLNVQANLVINLKGKTISGNFSDKDKETVINNTATLTLIGGTINNIAANGAAVITNSGKLILKGVTINGAPIADGSYPSYAVYSSGELTIEEGTTISSDRGAINMQNGANVTINGGNIKVTNALGTRSLTAHVIYAYGSDSKLTINNGNFEMAYEAQGNTGASVICPAGATIKVFYGEFSYAGVQGNQSGIFQNYMGYGAPVDVYGGTYNDNTVTKSGNLAEGYKAIEKDGKWYVVPEEVTTVAASEAEIIAALKVKNAVVYVYPTEDGSPYKLEGKLSLAEGVKLIGAGDEPVALFNDWGSNAFGNQAHFSDTHIENVYFTNNLIIDAGIANGNVTFKGCVFGGDLAHQGVHFDSGNGTITFDDCTFVGRNMFGSSLKNVIFNNCKFENKKSSQTGADKWTGVNMWGKYEFNNCEFDTEATCNVKCDGVIADFNNCFYSKGNDIKEVIRNSPAYTCTITIDGVVVAGLSSVLANAPKGSTIVLAEGVNFGEVTVGELKNVTILGSENTSMRFVTNADSKIENVTIKNIDFGFTTGTGQAGACVVINKDAEINNLVLDNITFVGDGNKNSYGITGQNSTASIIVKNCNFSNLGYAIQTISGGGYESLIVEKCTFDNIISWAILPQYGYKGDLTINNCTFKNSGGGLVKTGAFNGTFTFTNNTITSCTGHDGADSKWFEVNASAATKVIDGNIKDGAAWTPGEANGLK